MRNGFARLTLDDRGFKEIDFLKNNQQALLLLNLAAIIKEVVPTMFSTLPRDPPPLKLPSAHRVKESLFGMANFLGMVASQLVRIRLDSFEVVLADEKGGVKRIGLSHLLLWSEINDTQDLEIKLHVPSLKAFEASSKVSQLGEAKGFRVTLVLPFSFNWAKSISNSRVRVELSEINLRGSPTCLTELYGLKNKVEFFSALRLFIRSCLNDADYHQPLDYSPLELELRIGSLSLQLVDLYEPGIDGPEVH